MKNSDLEKRLDRLEAGAKAGKWWRRTALALIVLAIGLPFAADALGPVPNQFAKGDVLSAAKMNENFEHLRSGITALEEAPIPTVTIRKETGSAQRAIAFCESDEILTGGGCFLPPENDYDAGYPDFEMYNTGGFPRPLVGLTSVPVAAGTELTELRPTASPGGQIIPFAGDIVSENSGSVVAEPGGGWGCRAGIIQFNSAGSAQIISAPFAEDWYYHVKAYAICMKMN